MNALRRAREGGRVKPALETPASATEQPQRDAHVVPDAAEFGDCTVCLLPVAAHFDRPHCSGTAIGCRGARLHANVLTDRHIARAFGLGWSQFYKRKKAGDFRRFELTPQLPASNTRYSGARLQRWLDGDPLDGSTPATGRRYFGHARVTHAAESVPREDRRLRDGGSR